MEMSDAIASLDALAQETRLRLFRLLVQAGPRGLAAGRIGQALEVAPATLSFHLGQLQNAGLVRARREGRSIIYAANYASMQALVDFLVENCCGENGCGTECN